MDHVLNKEIGDRLRQLRKDENMTQAAILGPGSGQKTLSLMENGDQEVTLEVLIFWHKKGYSMNWIVTGEGPKKLDYNEEFQSLLEFKKEMVKFLKL